MTTLASDMKDPMFLRDNRGGTAMADAQAKLGNNAVFQPKKHVIISYETRQFLCMDDKSVVYQSSEYNESQCTFVHEMDSEYTDRYSRKVNESTPAWYLGINKDGSIRCGNVTRKNQDSAKFNRMAVDQTESSSSPPFIEQKKECCNKSRCKNKSDSGENTRNESKKCRRLRTRCKKQRRMVFKLSLKQLKKYYNKCVDSNSDFMKECRNKSKSKSKAKDRKRQRNRRRYRTDSNPR